MKERSNRFLWRRSPVPVLPDPSSLCLDRSLLGLGPRSRQHQARWCYTHKDPTYPPSCPSHPCRVASFKGKVAGGGHVCFAQEGRYSSKLNLVRLTGTEGGNYTFLASSSDTSSSKTFTVHVKSKPEIISQDGPINGTVGCIAAGYPVPEVSWYYCLGPHKRSVVNSTIQQGRPLGSAVLEVCIPVPVLVLLVVGETEEVMLGCSGELECSVVNSTIQQGRPLGSAVLEVCIPVPVLVLLVVGETEEVMLGCSENFFNPNTYFIGKSHH
ncbi:UNVERIFIED_CONTAM: hypothetical protein FKN15_055495 [Acipenser sinensis]